jgi:hypothetical protein
MRTTLDLEKPVLDALKARGEKEGTSLGKLASRLLAEAMAREESDKPSSPPFRWISTAMNAKVDLSDKDALYRALDGS